jgi:thioredoxin 2
MGLRGEAAIQGNQESFRGSEKYCQLLDFNPVQQEYQPPTPASTLNALPGMLTYSPCPDCRKLNRLAPQAAGKQPVCGQCKRALPMRGWVNELGPSELMLLVEKSPLPVVADFWAPWCAPCRSFAPVFEQAAGAMAGHVVFAKVDTQAYPLASQSFGIRGVPTLIVFRGGLERARQSGAMPLPRFLEWLRGTGVAAAA